MLYYIMHLGDAFIQIDLYCIEDIWPVLALLCLGIKPTTFGFASIWATGKHRTCIQYSDAFISTRCDTDINVRISCAGFPLACCSGCALITRLIRLQLLFSGHYRGGGVTETRLTCQKSLCRPENTYRNDRSFHQNTDIVSYCHNNKPEIHL